MLGPESLFVQLNVAFPSQGLKGFSKTFGRQVYFIYRSIKQASQVGRVITSWPATNNHAVARQARSMHPSKIANHSTDRSNSAMT